MNKNQFYLENSSSYDEYPDVLIPIYHLHNLHNQQQKTMILQTLTDDIIDTCCYHLHPKQDLTENPSCLTNPYWQWVVHHRLNPYQITDLMPQLKSQFKCSTDEYLPPLWSFERIGQSETILPDGRMILIGGEFDDFYDPNFCIFNDVIVKYPNGHIDIYGYSHHIFMPTDFHTASLIGDEIFIIGNLGDVNHRQYTATPIYKLNIHSFKIQKIESRNSIGWINSHTASVKDGQIIIKGGRIFDHAESPMRENIDEWAFNPKTLVWTNLTNHQWQGFWLHRQDFNELLASKYQSAMLYEYLLDDSDALEHELKHLQEHLGHHFNYQLYKQLFKPPICHSEVIVSFDNYHEVLIYILDDIKIRYIFDDDYIQVYIEGQLTDEQYQLLQDNLCHTLSKLEYMSCAVKPLPFHTPFNMAKNKVKRVKR